MSKLRPDKINFYNDNFVVELDKKEELIPVFVEQQEEQIPQQQIIEPQTDNNEVIEQAQNEAQSIIDNARKEAQDILKEAKENAKTEEEKILDNARKEAQDILKEAKDIEQAAKKEREELLSNSEDEIEKSRIEATRKGYEEGHQDGLEKIQEELEEKITNFDKFIGTQQETKEKILKSASRDITDIICAIAKKVLIKEVDGETIEKIIKETISLFDKKENINIILSEKYARLLFELQKKALDDGAELDFSQFKQYDNFNIIYNPKYDDDTIIVENPTERFDASINSQLDIIIRDINETK